MSISISWWVINSTSKTILILTTKVVEKYFANCKPIVENRLNEGSGIARIDTDEMTDSVLVEFEPLLIAKVEIKMLEKSCYKFVRIALCSL